MEVETAIEHAVRTVRGPYRRRSVGEKRGIVEQCLKPGASVAGVALAHGVNANLVRKWIAKYRAGQYGQAGVALLPVRVDTRPAQAPRAGASAPAPHGIEIELPGARVRVHGRVDAEALRIVLDALTR